MPTLNSKTSHTPGPWHVGKNEANQRGIWAMECLPIAQVHYVVGDSAEANARLIAAAPELLEALKAFRACAEYMTAGEPIANAQRMADAAIAKATQP